MRKGSFGVWIRDEMMTILGVSLLVSAIYLDGLGSLGPFHMELLQCLEGWGYRKLQPKHDIVAAFHGTMGKAGGRRKL